tara:strand:+ start:6955 stop:7530 length:576 start_codon:yes stop_codon:yes gene_type:complete
MTRKNITIILVLFLVLSFAIYYYWSNIKTQILKLTISSHNKSFIDTLNPQAKLIFVGFINKVNRVTDYDIYITSSYRTPEEQTALQATEPLAVAAMNSYHQFGMALDLNPVSKEGGVFVNSSKSIQEWLDTGVPQIAEEFGLRWGGYFNTTDKVHFDMGNYYSIQELRDTYTNQLAYSPTLAANQIILPVA